MLFKVKCNAFQIVVLCQKGILGGSLGNPGTVGRSKGYGSTSGLNQKGIGMTVITTCKFDDLFPSGIASGQSYGTHTGFGTGIDHSDLINIGYHLYCQLGDLGFQFGGHTVGGSSVSSFLNRFDDRFKSMAQNHGAPTGNVVNESVPIFIIQIGTFGFLYKNRGATHGFKCADW